MTTLTLFAVLLIAATSASAKTGASDHALLKAGVLVGSDLPSGWKSRPVRLGATDRLQGVSGCEEQSTALGLPQRRAPSRAFYDPMTPPSGINSQASNLVRVFKNPAVADRYLSAYKAASAGPCLHQYNEDTLKGQNPSSEVALTDFAPLSNLGTMGDDSVAYGAAISASTQQFTVSGPLNLIFVRVGRAVLGFKLGLENANPSLLTDITSHPIERTRKVQQ